jgi:VWFA-related protein
MKLTLPLLALFAATSTCAQETPTISTKVNTVSILATVHDQDGRVVSNLTQSDFSLLEDGVPQTIDYFSHESNLPLTIGLLVDTSRSQDRVLDEERNASFTFFNQVLREKQDQAFVVSFDRQVQALTGVTSSLPDLQSALNRLEIPRESATLIFSAVKDSAENQMHPLSGRKAFILLTDGVAFRDPDNIEEAIEFAQRSDVMIFTILFSSRPPFRGVVASAVIAEHKARGKKDLERMARETGGIAFEVTPTRSVSDIYAEIEDLLRNQYTLGYTPPRAQPDNKFHHLKLTTKNQHDTVNARNGYYAN